MNEIFWIADLILGTKMVAAYLGPCLNGAYLSK